MKKIELTQGKFALVDDDDFEELSKHKWCAFKNGNYFYAARRGPDKKLLLMHRVLMNETNPDIIIDHRNLNGLDNQRLNLRRATKSQNAMNKKAQGRSKYLGVHFSKKNNKWRAQIKVNGKTIRIGYFKLEEEAAKAYDKKAIEFHGEFANPNFKCDLFT